MRVTSMFVAVVLIVGSCLNSGNSARAASGTDYMVQALGQMMATVRYLSDQTVLGYENSGICLAGVVLQKGESYDLERSFSAGVDYVLIAGGDEDALDVDLKILKGNREVVSDTSENRCAVTRFTPSRSGRYTIRMKLYDATQVSFCAFAVMQRNGYDVPVSNLVVAGNNFLGMCAAAGNLGNRNRCLVSFPDSPHQAAVWGTVLRSGQSQTIRRLQLGGTPSVFLAAGDTQSRDLDLYVKDGSGNVVGRDVLPDAFPVVEHDSQAGQHFALTITNAERSGNPTFALFGVVQMHK